MSRAAIMSFMPFLASLLPERISKMEKGRFYRDRFVAISEVTKFLFGFQIKFTLIDLRNFFLGLLSKIVGKFQVDAISRPRHESMKKQLAKFVTVGGSNAN